MEGVDKGQITFRVFPSQQRQWANSWLPSYGGNLTFSTSFDTYKIVHGSEEIKNFSSNIHITSGMSYDILWRLSVCLGMQQKSYFAVETKSVRFPPLSSSCSSVLASLVDWSPTITSKMPKSRSTQRRVPWKLHRSFVFSVIMQNHYEQLLHEVALWGVEVARETVPDYLLSKALSQMKNM